MTELPIAPLKRLLQNVGAKRVSEDATKEFGATLEEIGEDIAIHANQLARHAGRKTIKAEDIILASKDYL